MITRKAGWNVLEEPTVPDVMPGHSEHYLHGMYFNYPHNVGHKELLSSFRTYVSYASSSVVHKENVKAEMVSRHMSVGGNRHDSAPVNAP